MFVEIPIKIAEIGVKLGTNSCIATRYWKESFHKIAEEDFNRIQKESKMKKAVEKKRKTITIDITDWYDRLKDISQKEIRSIEEQCRFFIKKGIEGNYDNVTTTYFNYDWTKPNLIWQLNPCTSESNASSISHSDGTAIYCSNNGKKSKSYASTGEAVDCEINDADGCYEVKC